MNNGFNNNNNNNTRESDVFKGSNNNNEVDFTVKSPVEPRTPPKPIKKRIFEKFADDNDFASGNNISDMTQQELLNKVVDHMFIQEKDEFLENLKEPRKSGRSCKGKRYEQFMVEGKLLSGKRDKKYFDLARRFDDELHSKMEAFQKPETPNLETTIKRLAERTQKPSEEPSEDSYTKNLQNEFNLDLRISNLPSLSYDAYMQRKRESKKRKIRPKSDGRDFRNEGVVNSSPIGSKKRKNKRSITHLEKKELEVGGGFVSDLSGLATLAEVAANIEKIN